MQGRLSLVGKFKENFKKHLYLISGDEDREYGELIQDWCLQINAEKNKELVEDFHKHKHPPLSPVNIQGLDSYKYLGVLLNNKLDWTDNMDAIRAIFC